MSRCECIAPARRGRLSAVLAARLTGAPAATAMLSGCVAAAAVVVLGGCTAASPPAPAGSPSSHTGAGAAATVSPGAGTATPSPAATITAGPVPAAAAQAAVQYWRLVDAHRYRALLTVVTPDSQAAAAVQAGRSTAFWGIERVGIVSTEATVDPAPPSGTTLEFTMTVDITPSRASAWSGGQTLVFMSLRRVGGSWLVYDAGSGP